MSQAHEGMPALLIGPRNAELVVGAPWRWVRDHARKLGVGVLRVDGKSFVDAQRFVDALKLAAPPPTPAPTDELAAMRARLRGAA